MTPGDIAAYIGAAAWLPQIGVWAYGALTTPKLKLVSAGNIEIWFSTAGPGATATFAFSADRRDALIEKMNLRATHQDGDKRDFDWRFLNDNQSQSRDAQGNISSQFRTIPAVALKVSTISLVEKTVGFHNAQFEEHFNPLFSQMMELYRHNETKLGSAAALEHILQSLEFEKTQRAYLESLFWRGGFRAHSAVPGVREDAASLSGVTVLAHRQVGFSVHGETVRHESGTRPTLHRHIQG